MDRRSKRPLDWVSSTRSKAKYSQPVGHGVALAQALDQQMHENGLPSVLESLGTNVGTADDALSEFLSWNVDDPSAGEKVAFRSALYAPARIDSPTSIGLRSATLKLVIEVLTQAGKPLTVDEVREALFWGTGARPSVSAIPAIDAAHHRWIVLQVRQAQRLAMEALLSWIEKRIIYDGDSDTRALAAAGTRACKDDSRLTDGGGMDFIKRRSGYSNQTLSEAIQEGATNDQASIFYLMRHLQENIRNEIDEVVPSALLLLSLCREYTILLEEVSDLRSSLRYGGAEGLSLASWREVSDRAADFKMEVLASCIRRAGIEPASCSGDSSIRRRCCAATSYDRGRWASRVGAETMEASPSC